MKLGLRLRSVALFEQLGPGLVTGAADDDARAVGLGVEVVVEDDVLDFAEIAFARAEEEGACLVPALAAAVEFGEQRGPARRLDADTAATP